jgi:hypothetical protein
LKILIEKSYNAILELELLELILLELELLELMLLELELLDPPATDKTEKIWVNVIIGIADFIAFGTFEMAPIWITPDSFLNVIAANKLFVDKTFLI